MGKPMNQKYGPYQGEMPKNNIVYPAPNQEVEDLLTMVLHCQIVSRQAEVMLHA